MDVNEIKKLSIEHFLQNEGICPVRANERELWYASPFRDERTPSFKVDVGRNVWYDFGEGEGGDVINLVMKFHRVSFREAIRRLEPFALSPAAVPIRFHGSAEAAASAKTESVGGLEILSANPLTYGPLLDYMHSRMITDDAVVRRYCFAVTYRCRGRKYFAVGFRNMSGGFELRNRYAKLSSSPKDITLISDGAATSCCAFEGFMDFLSFLIMGPKNIIGADADCMVLNSVSNAERAIPHVRRYGRVYCFFDNDDAGRKAFSVFDRSGVPATDMSCFYSPSKDLNEYLCKCGPAELVTVSGSRHGISGSKRSRHYVPTSCPAGHQQALTLQEIFNAKNG